MFPKTLHYQKKLYYTWKPFITALTPWQTNVQKYQKTHQMIPEIAQNVANSKTIIKRWLNQTIRCSVLHLYDLLVETDFPIRSHFLPRWVIGESHSFMDQYVHLSVSFTYIISIALIIHCILWTVWQVHNYTTMIKVSALVSLMSIVRQNFVHRVIPISMCQLVSPTPVIWLILLILCSLTLNLITPLKSSTAFVKWQHSKLQKEMKKSRM